jgi:hypothetical protein
MNEEGKEQDNWFKKVQKGRHRELRESYRKMGRIMRDLMNGRKPKEKLTGSESSVTVDEAVKRMEEAHKIRKQNRGALRSRRKTFTFEKVGY